MWPPAVEIHWKRAGKQLIWFNTRTPPTQANKLIVHVMDLDSMILVWNSWKGTAQPAAAQMPCLLFVRIRILLIILIFACLLANMAALTMLTSWRGQVTPKFVEHHFFGKTDFAVHENTAANKSRFTLGTQNDTSTSMCPRNFITTYVQFKNTPTHEQLQSKAPRSRIFFFHTNQPKHRFQLHFQTKTMNSKVAHQQRNDSANLSSRQSINSKRQKWQSNGLMMGDAALYVVLLQSMDKCLWGKHLRDRNQTVELFLGAWHPLATTQGHNKILYLLAWNALFLQFLYTLGSNIFSLASSWHFLFTHLGSPRIVQKINFISFWTKGLGPRGPNFYFEI